MPRRLVIFADLFGRPQYADCFTQGPSRSRHFTAFPYTEFPPDEEQRLSRRPAAHREPEPKGIESQAEWLQRRPEALAELSRLTPKQREAIDEVLFKGRTITDLANECETSLDSVRQRVVGTQRPGGKVHGGLMNKAPILYALWLFRHRDRHDIAEVQNAIARATASVHLEQPDRPA